MANILITGGAGFIGTNLMDDLVSRGHNVKTLDIKPNHNKNHIRIDVTYFEQLARYFDDNKFDFVFHLAAEYGRWNGEDHYDNLWRVNVVGLKNILRIQQQQKFKLISFSSAEVYGDFSGKMSEEIMDEIPIKQMNDYAISKWAGELQCLNHADMFGSEIVRVRPVNCYGPHEYYDPYRGVVPIFVHKCLIGESFTVHKGHKRIFDYVTDTARTVANISENFIAGEVYNVGSSEDWEITIEQLADIVIDVTGVSSQLVNVVGEESFTTKVKTMDFSKARRDLDHNAVVGIEEGVSKYASWMRDYYKHIGLIS